MAAKEKKASITKHLTKDNQSEKLTDSTKLRRGVRKSAPPALNDTKTCSEQKSPAASRKKRTAPPQDGRVTPSTRKRKNVTDVEEEHEASKSPPHTGSKTKKTFLEKELEDILENATGRNTPSTPRNRKANEREEENLEADKFARTRNLRGSSDPSSSTELIDDRGVLGISKTKKTNEKDADDDNVSVRSFSTLRTRKAADKDADDDSLAVSKKGETNNDDSTSVAGPSRSNMIKKVSRKKKTATKKKIYMKRGRPKKGQSDAKGKKTGKKKSSKKKAQEEMVDGKESKRSMNKSLKYQNMTGSQRRLRSAMTINNQKSDKPSVTTEEKSQLLSPKGFLISFKDGKPQVIEIDEERLNKERLQSDGHNLKNELSKLDGSGVVNEMTEESKKDVGTSKRKFVKKDTGKKGDGKFELREKCSDLLFCTEGETAPKSNGDKVSQKMKQVKIKRTKKFSSDSRKRKRVVPGLHFETTSSPDDSSVIIVQPRLGPKMKYARLNQLHVNKPAKKIRPKEVVPNNVLPVSSTATVSNFNQIGSSYFVQSIPNFKLLATNSTIIRSYNASAATNPNLDSTRPASPNNLPYVEEADRSLTSLGPKIWPNDVIVTPSGIVLSNSRLISNGGNQQAPNICINGSNAAFLSDSPNSNILYSAQNSVGNLSTTKLFYQNSSNIMQPQTCTKTTTAVLLERSDSTSMSVVNSTTGTVVANSDGGARLNATADVGKLNGYSTEKASEGGENDNSEKCKDPLSDSGYLPAIPVAKNVNELLMLKGKAEDSESTLDKTDGKNTLNNKLDALERRKNEKHDAKKTRRILRNVRQNHSSVSELTFSEPENSCCEKEETSLYKTISCERLDKSLNVEETNAKVLLQLGSEPMPISESIAPFETASAFLLDQSGKYGKKFRIDLAHQKDSSCQTKGAADVCNFSGDNAEGLRELSLGAGADQTRAETDEESSSTKTEQNTDATLETMDRKKKEKIKEEVDNVLKEMPNRKIPNLFRKSECFNVNKRKIELKTPLVSKSNDYLSKSPSKPPTVIDKLLERNKSLKKAEQESRYQNSVQNLTESLQGYEKNEQKQKRTLREVRTRKYAKTEQRLVANKSFVSTTSGCKVYERRDSSPDNCSSNHLTAGVDVSNENVPLRRALEICEKRDTYQRRGSIDFEPIQKVPDRRNSLPVTSGKSEDTKKVKTENIKTILIRSSTPLTNKNHGGEQQTRVINIITGDDGSKKGQNLMEEIGMEIEKEAKGKAYVNGDKDGRRTSVESSENSETESLKKFMNGITVSKSQTSTESPYTGEKSTPRVEKIRLSVERKSSEGKKSAVIEESPEDLVTKETILSALGLRRTAVQNVQKDSTTNSVPRRSDSGNYTGTLKTVIKLQRQEKKGNSKTPMKMIYKASSSSPAVSGQNAEHNTEQDADEASKDETEEEKKNGNGKAKSLVIPEKASSFSIHPGKLCSDVCAYCFGKFGLLDTPCHIAQLKDAHKRINILSMESHLRENSCLCDACFRHVDKKSNCPTFTEKKIDKRKFQGRKQVCCARNCNAESQHNLRRKWFAKLKKSIGRKIVLDQAKLDKVQPAHLVTLCNRHFYWIDYFMSCGICKRRLTSGNMYRVIMDITELNAALSADGIPTILTDKRFLCKICHCYASIRVKFKNPSEMSPNQCQFYDTYRKRILQCHEIDVHGSENEAERDSRPAQKNVKRTRKSAKPTATVTNGGSKSGNETEVSTEEAEKGNEAARDSDMNEVSHMNIPPKTNGNLNFGGVTITPSTTEVNPTQIHVKMGNVNIGALGNLNIGQDVRHGTRSNDVQCYPTEAELGLRAHFDLQPSAEDESVKAERKGFDKCTTTIQLNPETKHLFYSLQMPYGNHSSFFRHLILLEKYFRSGDLVVSRNADPRAISYISSIQNRIRSYEGIHNPMKKPLEIPPSLSILPQPVKTETRNAPEIQPSVIQSRPFTLTPMPANSSLPKNSPLSHMQATVQNIQGPGPSNQVQSQGFVKSLLKSNNPTANHPKPDISITSVPIDHQTMAARVGKAPSQTATGLTSKIQENLRNLASKSQGSKQLDTSRPVLLNRSVDGEKQNLVQLSSGGRTIHLTLYQFRRIQQMQMRKKLYMEHQAKARAQRMKEESLKKMKAKTSEERFNIKNLSPELEIQEIRQSSSGNDMLPVITDVRSLAGEENTGWENSTGDFSDQTDESFPRIPKALSVSVTKVPATESPPKDRSHGPVE